jgi:hypothetical protein
VHFFQARELRLSHHVVKGYAEDKKSISAVATMEGAFQHASEYGKKSPFLRSSHVAVEVEQMVHDELQGDRNQEINPVIIALRDALIRLGVPLEPEVARADLDGDPHAMQNAWLPSPTHYQDSWPNSCNFSLVHQRSLASKNPLSEKGFSGRRNSIRGGQSRGAINPEVSFHWVRHVELVKDADISEDVVAVFILAWDRPGAVAEKKSFDAHSAPQHFLRVSVVVDYGVPRKLVPTSPRESIYIRRIWA